MSGAERAPSVSRLAWRRGDPPAVLRDREWLVTNGLGGYASGSLGGELTRRYHGLLVAALPIPRGRTMMLCDVDDEIVAADGTSRALSMRATPTATPVAAPPSTLSTVRIDQRVPVWTYSWADQVVEKRVVMPYGQNTTHVVYRRTRGEGTLRLRVRPVLQVRRLEDPVSTPSPAMVVTAPAEGSEVLLDAAGLALRLRIVGGAPRFAARTSTERQFYALEAARGYDAEGVLWSPGVFEADLDTSGSTALVASTEPWDVVRALTPQAAVAAETQRSEAVLAAVAPSAKPALAELALAADQFIITPAARVAEAAQARAEGDELRTVIAGYHWFTDWGRDTMISLDGLLLATGRHREAALVLRTFARHVRRGLIPNLIPDGDGEGLYNTADATLWYFHALHRYLAASGDRSTLRALLPMLHDVIRWHIRGTDFNIGVDPVDGLLHQGADGFQLTWMDAKVGDWVVTPRRGKAVEIQALWYNALRLMEGWCHDDGGDPSAASGYADLAARAHASFNERFWFAAGGHLYDVVDGEGGDDPSCRPNQVLALSLEHPILAAEHWGDVMSVVAERLLTPMGLRSLAPGSSGYSPRYDGDLRARDAAYHQGTVWGWLIGPYIDAWARLHSDSADARPLLDGLLAHLGDAGVGQMSEIFDAEPPYAPRGCIAQAWTVAEVLRCLVRIDAGGDPGGGTSGRPGAPGINVR